ncbi:hypothetical protein MRX96_033894 [Rhipicephalus microplus]
MEASVVRLVVLTSCFTVANAGVLLVLHCCSSFVDLLSRPLAHRCYSTHLISGCHSTALFQDKEGAFKLGEESALMGPLRTAAAPPIWSLIATALQSSKTRRTPLSWDRHRL